MAQIIYARYLETSLSQRISIPSLGIKDAWFKSYCPNQDWCWNLEETPHSEAKGAKNLIFIRKKNKDIEDCKKF